MNFKQKNSFYYFAPYIIDSVYCYFFKFCVSSGIWIKQAKQTDDRAGNLHAFAQENPRRPPAQHRGIRGGEREPAEPALLARSVQSRTPRADASLLHQRESRPLAPHRPQIRRPPRRESQTLSK